MEAKPVARRTTAVAWSTPLEPLCATTGTVVVGVQLPATSSATNALAADEPITELRNALELRKCRALTPYDPESWHDALSSSKLLERYPSLPLSLQLGFDLGIRRIHQSYTPNNDDLSLSVHNTLYREIVENEFNRKRYIGPCSRKQVELLIGPFHSSPLSLIPKPGKPGKYRAIHNFSYPNKPSLDTQSINYTIDPTMFPCTWGTFATMSNIIWHLPEGSQASVRDVAEAYRTIPVLPDQWPGLVVKLHEEDSYAINTSNNFGLASAGGVYGELCDAATDIFRAQGIGPLTKWVDDHVFLRMPRESIPAYNEKRKSWHKEIMANGGRLHEGSRIWYRGETLPDGSAAEFDEDASCSLADFSQKSPRSPQDSLFSYCDTDIDLLSGFLGIPWEPSKTIPFGSQFPYLGFLWNILTRTVSILPTKQLKYKEAIQEWRFQPTHMLEEVRKLYGKLLHTCLVIPAGRAYLTSLETMLGSFGDRPFTPHHAPRETAADLDWWFQTLSSPNLTRSIPGPRQVADCGAFSDASSGVGIGIVIQGKWRAWRLIPGWNQEGRDIGWAEAVGFEFLVRTLLTVSNPGDCHKVYGDNRGVVEGWWKGRSKNKPVNVIFRRIHALSAIHECSFISRYVPSKENPADAPSRAVFPPRELLLPPIVIPHELHAFVIDYDNEPLPCEHRLQVQGFQQPQPLPKPSRFDQHEPRDSETDPDWLQFAISEDTAL
jgi:hypothetical protein